MARSHSLGDASTMNFHLCISLLTCSDSIHTHTQKIGETGILADIRRNRKVKHNTCIQTTEVVKINELEEAEGKR